MRFRLETGRTHQIRMHARHEGHPILGDKLYGGKTADPAVRAAAAGLGRQALHAAILGFRHPRDGGRVRFEAPLPDDLQRTLKELELAG
jgi:23S rRNA pseudouridine1911/1915/1917 synthase